MEEIVLRKVDKDEFGRVKLLEQSYSLDRIASIKYGKIGDFHNDQDIAGNGMDGNESCLYITFFERDKYGDLEHATFGSDWEITFE